MRAAELEVPQFAGITAHEGSYLAQFVLGRGYAGHGVVRHTSSPKRSGLAPLWHTSPSAWDPVAKHLGPGDLTDGGNVQRLVRATERTEVHTLATQCHVGVPFNQRGYTNHAGRPSTPPLTEPTQNVEAPFRLCRPGTSELCRPHPPLRTAGTRFRRGDRDAVATLSARTALVPGRSVERVSRAWMKVHQRPRLSHRRSGPPVCRLTHLSFRQIGGLDEALEAANGRCRRVRALPRGYTMAWTTATANHKRGASGRWQKRRKREPHAGDSPRSARAHDTVTAGHLVGHYYVQGRWLLLPRTRLRLGLVLLSLGDSKRGRLGCRPQVGSL